MKKILLAVFVVACSFRALADGPNEKVLNAFNKTFQNAQDVSWSENPNSYEVKFKQNEIMSRVTYDKDGNIVRSLRYYYEQQLPILVLTKVRTKFPNEKIFGVTEESSDEGTFYHIVLENEKNWINITTDNDGIVIERKKYDKG